MKNLQSINIDQIELDTRNPRTNNGKIKNREDVITELILEDIGDLIEKISKFGFLGQSVLTVVKNGEKYIKIDGNRRLLALKVLKFPDSFKKYLSNNQFNKYKKISINEKINEVNCVVHTNREDADKEMAILHLSGEQIRKWKLIRQYRYFYEKIKNDGYSIDDLSEMFDIKKSFIHKGIVLYNLFQYAQNHFSSKYTITDTKFKMDKFARFTFTGERRRFLEYDFDMELLELTFHRGDNYFKERLDYILSKVFDSMISAQIKKEDIDGLLKSHDPQWLNGKEYKKAAEEENKTNNEQATLFKDESNGSAKKEDESNGSAKKEDTGLYENDIKRYVPNLIKKSKKAPGLKSKKIKSIYKELQNVSVKTCPTATFALLRILIDISVHEFLKSKEHKFNEHKHLIIVVGNNKKTLKEKIDFISSEYLGKGNDLRKAVAALNDDYLVKNLNEIMHNTIFQATESKIRDYWKNLLPFLEFIWGEIKKNKNFNKK